MDFDDLLKETTTQKSEIEIIDIKLNALLSILEQNNIIDANKFKEKVEEIAKRKSKKVILPIVV